MNTFLNFTVVGIATAAVYAIAASGLVVTYTTSGIFNFAHGAVGMISAFMYWQLHAPSVDGGWGLPAWLAIPLVLFVAAPLLGALLERVIMRGLEGATEVVKIVVTVSLLLALYGLAQWIWPGNITRSFPRLMEGTVSIGGTNVTYQRIIILVAALVVAGALRLLLYGSRVGIAMRAVVDDRNLVRLNGARPSRVSMLAWAMGASLAALSGILVAPLLNFDALALTLLVVNCYAAAVVGKLRSLPLTFLGALILGLGEAYCGAYLTKFLNWLTGSTSIGWFSLSGFQFALPALMLFVVMVAQPQARLRAGGVQRVRESWRVPTMNTAIFGAVALVVSIYGITELIGADPDRQPVVNAMFFAIVALSLVPLTGFAGQISLAQMSFVGLGAVMMRVIGEHGHTPGAVIVALVVCGVVGALVALPALRLTGIYLALATAAFSLFMSKMIFTQTKLVAGGTVKVPTLDLGVFAPTDNQQQAVMLAVVFAALALFVVWLRRGSYGRRLMAMKDSPVACATLGLDLTRTKIGVFALSASIAGLAGALANKSMPTTDFELLSSMSVTMLAVVGGIGAIGGAVIGGFLLGTFQSLIPTLLRDNTVGVFRFVQISVPDLMKFTPGFMGISLGRNPSGAIGDIGDAYRAVGETKESLGLAIFGPVALWFLARSDTISNWTFIATMAVMLLAIIPLLPVLLRPIPGGRALPAGVVLVVGLVVVGAIDWGTAISSTGIRLVLMIAAAVVLAGVATAVHGGVPSDAAEEPSPDMVGIDRPLTRSDVFEADRMLGLTEADFDLAHAGAGDDGAA
ncbi:MAG: ABC transporter permease [Acidimicrobiales bacterium]